MLREPPYVTWVSVNPASGNIEVYPEVQAYAIERAWRSGKKCVELGPNFHNSSVHFKDRRPFQRTPGGWRDVRRVCLSRPEEEILLNVIMHERADFYTVADIQQETTRTMEERTAVPGNAAINVADVLNENPRMNLWDTWSGRISGFFGEFALGKSHDRPEAPI